MGKRGPKPTPTIKLANRGSWRAKTRGNEPQVKNEIPCCPAWLNGREAKAEWRWCVKQLAGMIGKIDRTALAAYCDAFADFLKYRELADKTRPMLQTDKGNWVQSPLVAMKNRARDAMTKLASEFGMTPSSRSRVQVTKGSKDDGKQGKQRFFDVG